MSTRDVPIRVGAVSYLNTRPLVFGLERHAREVELILDLPSRLADGLAAGQYDVALIPSLEYFQNPEYQIVSDACIACRGPVWSVKLLSRVPPHRIGTLALDEGSRTSAGLLRILLKERYGIEPQLQLLPIGQTPESVASDAVLLIGDRAMAPPPTQFTAVWDLGEEWCRWSGLPFVFAMWVGRRTADWNRLAEILSSARDDGLRHLRAIAEREATAHALSTDSCLSYFQHNLHFILGPRELRGLELFQEHAVRCGLAPSRTSAPSAPLRSAAGCASPMS